MYAPILYPAQASSFDSAPIAAGVLTAPRIEKRGHLFADTIVRGKYKGLPIEIRFEQRHTRRSGTKKLTTVSLLIDAGGAPMYLGGAHVGYSSREAHIGFPQPALADFNLVGAPRALIAKLATGKLGRRLAAMRILSLDVGPYALAAGCPIEGIVLGAHGWPSTPAAVLALLDCVVELRKEIFAELTLIAGPGVRTFRHVPEVIAHEAARARARAAGRTLVAAVLAGVAVAVSFVGVAATAMLLSMS